MGFDLGQLAHLEGRHLCNRWTVRASNWPLPCSHDSCMSKLGMAALVVALVGFHPTCLCSGSSVEPVRLSHPCCVRQLPNPGECSGPGCSFIDIASLKALAPSLAHSSLAGVRPTAETQVERDVFVMNGPIVPRGVFRSDDRVVTLRRFLI